MATDTDPSVEINGYALRVIRILTGISSPQALAETIGRTAGYVRMIETGSQKRVSAALYRQLMSALAITDYRVLLANPHGNAPAEPATPASEAVA